MTPKDIALGLIISFMVLMGIQFGMTRPVAKEIRLVGSCDGKYYAAMEEDNFSIKCDWIESADHLALDHFE